MIIGLSGQMACGKDTSADHFVSAASFVKVSLADPIKRIAADVYGFSEDVLWGESSLRNRPDLRYPREHNWVSNDGDDTHCACCGFSATRVGFDVEQYPKCFLTARYALQLIGTEMGRQLYINTWIDKGLRTAKDLIQGGYAYNRARGLERSTNGPASGVVFPDVRFRNEISAIRSAGGKLVRIVRPSQVSTSTHPSEVEQRSIPDSDFDAVIVNDGSLADLQARLHQILEAFR